MKPRMSMEFQVDWSEGPDVAEAKHELAMELAHKALRVGELLVKTSDPDERRRLTHLSAQIDAAAATVGGRIIYSEEVLAALEEVLNPGPGGMPGDKREE